MDSKTIAVTKSGDVFVFDYAHLDVAYSVTLGSGSWGLYQADGNVAVRDTLTPQIGSDGVTSKGGSYRTSISLPHVDTYSTARVHYDGQGFTLEYTLDNGTSWHTLAEDGVIPLPANPDLDLRVTFPGNIANDPAVLTSLSVYVLGSETMKSTKGVRALTFHNDPLTDAGFVFSTSAVVGAANATPVTDPNDPTTPTGPPDYSVGSIEMWVTPTTNSVFSAGPAGKVYTNGVLAAPLAGIKQHVVLVLDTPGNIAFTLAPAMTVSHLAVYKKAFSASEVMNLYTAQGGNPIISVTDSGAITVTESATAVDIYAYAWQIQSGGS